jgi:chemotaxis protein CheC
VNAPSAPTELQLDALREVANVGVGQAASALARLLGGRRVSMSVPRVEVLPLREVVGLLGGPAAPLVAVSLQMCGELTGHMLLAMDDRHARALAGALLSQAPRADGALLSEEERSALAEVANITGSACLSAIGKLTNLKLLPSPPALSRDAAQAVVRQALLHDLVGEARAVVLEARMLLEGLEGGLEGQLLLVPDAPSLRTLLARLGV